MSQKTEIQAGFQRLVTELNAAKAERGDKTALSTTDKTTLVAAINEIKAAADNASTSGGAQINDGSTSSTIETWSITKIASEIAAKVADVVGTAPAALDTLQELAAALQNNDLDIATVLTDLGNRVRVDAAQSLSSAEQETARDNINTFSKDEIGDVDFDYVADIETTLT